MSSTPNKDDFVARYCTIKHSWKGKYTRLFCIGRNCVATINPNSIFKVTNCWDYPFVIDCVPSPKAVTDITLNIKKDTMTFSCMSSMERAELLTDIQKFRHRFDTKWSATIEQNTYKARKYRSNEEWGNLHLQVTNTALRQKNPADGAVVGEYMFMHITGIGKVKDNARAFIVRYTNEKLHLFESDLADVIMKQIREYATKYIGLPPIPELDPMPSYEFDQKRLGVDRGELASTAEFPVMKISPKHDSVPVRRIFSTTEKHIVEREPSTYNATTVYPITDIFVLIRCEDDAQKLMVEFKFPHVVKTYTSPYRDALLAHLVDSCRRAGNTNVAVLTSRVDRGKRAAPCRCYVSEEIESTLLRCLIEPAKGGGPTTMPFNEIVEFFNANVEYSGLRFTENREGIFAENREKLIYGAFNALLNNFPVTEDPYVLVQQFYALRRLCVTRIGYSSAAVVPQLVRAIGAASVTALKLHHTAVSHAVIDFLNTLMTPMHDFYNPYHDQVNKHRMLSSESFVKHLLTLLRGHIEQDSGALVIHSLLDFFVYALCPPYSETTDEEMFHFILRMLVDTLGKPLFFLFQHPCKAIRYAAGLLIRVIVEEGDEDTFFTIQRAALSEGGFLRQFHIAAYGNDRELRDLARRLITYFCHDNQQAQDLLRRMVPVTLLHFLQSKEQPPDDELEQVKAMDVKAQNQQFIDAKNQWFRKKFNPKQASAAAQPQPGEEEVEVVIYRERQINVVPSLNWTMFFYQVKQDHLRPDLIWNHNTRTELRDAIDNEIQAFQVGLELRKERNVAWNYQEFEVVYPSLADELKIGQHYPRLLFECKDPVIARPKDFFNDMYHRFLLVQDFSMKCQCLHGMALLYQHYPEEIGQFNDIEAMMQMLVHSSHPTFRDRMLSFIGQLLRARLNVKPFIDCQGVKPLVDLLPMAHLHIDRPQIHSNTMAIESAVKPEDLQDQEKEWYYTNEQGEKQSPVSFAKLRTLVKEGAIKPTTKVWAQGQGGWKDLKDVPQLKWGILAQGMPSIMTLTEVSCTVLDILTLICAYYPSRDEDGSIMQPMPRVKRALTDPSVLPHIVQLLLTFDPAICNRVCRLLHILMEDNPLMSRLFLNGAFFFALMYTGSDIVPLCRLLHLTHRKQSFSISHDNEIIRTSILSPMLPPAMVCVLSNHGPQKFAEIFLGEYETPEAIWGKEMRRYLVEKIAAHLADFTPRLLGNVRATYSYCPIVGVEYEQLQNELFCSMYYLRHLCDEIKYPNWPVVDCVAVMRDVLTAWKLELEKKPSTLSRASCLETLDLKDVENPTPAQIRKAYFKLAAVYHPDKNPNGRDMFEAVQKAYEYLASDKVESDKPDPMRIYLLLRTQSILFKRFPEVMSTYKYAGYQLLLRLMVREFEDPEMLTKDVCLMDAAVELCFHTVNNAPLNADELLCEGGLELISQVMCRCMEQVTEQTKDTEVHCKIVANAIRTFTVAGMFKDCLIRIMSMPVIGIHATRAIAFGQAPSLSRAGISCIHAFCAHDELQELATTNGAVWHLLLYIFKYDYTLEEAGVDINEENHTQLFANRAAKAAFRCLCAIAGFHPNDDDLQTRENPPVQSLMRLLLTPWIVKTMTNNKNSEPMVLKLLNSNSETPYFLWNNTSRAELRDFVQTRSDLCRRMAGGAGELPGLNCDGFEYSAHQKELIVGGVFVRIYNLQPHYPIEDPMGFFLAMVECSERCVMQEKEVDEAPPQPEEGDNNDDNAVAAEPTKKRVLAPDTDKIALQVEAMRNVIIAYPHTHVVAAERMAQLLKLITVDHAPSVSGGMDLLSKCCNHVPCMTACGQIPTTVSEIVLGFRQGESVWRNGLAFVHQGLHDRLFVQQVLDRGLYVWLLHIFIVSRQVETKEEACVCLAKAFSDKLHGPKILLRSKKLIPGVFLETMKENPTQVCQMFETWQENPELVWNAEKKSRIANDVARAKTAVCEAVVEDKEIHWKLPEELRPPETIEDLQVGDVYLSLFVKQPNWAVRKPREFLQSLLEKFVEQCSMSNPDKEVLELVTQCVTAFIDGQPSVADFIVAFGFIPKLFKLVEAENPLVCRSATFVVHSVAASKACVESMNACDPIASLLVALEQLPDDLGIVMDTMERLVSRSSDRANIIKLALSNQLIQKLLSMLETGMSSQGSSASSARAIIIKVLKSMSKTDDPVFGPQVNHILNESQVWWKYKDQNHDLFLTSGAFGGFLTGPKQGPTLSLAAPPTRKDDDEPPPLD